jgi:hypothetical protein
MMAVPILSDVALLASPHDTAANEINAAIIFREAKRNLSLCADRVSAQTLKLSVSGVFIKVIH